MNRCSASPIATIDVTPTTFAPAPTSDAVVERIAEPALMASSATTALPWRVRADMKTFRAVTMGKPLVMGRKTFESIGKPLPGRDNIVITRSEAFEPAGVIVARDIDQALDLAMARALDAWGGDEVAGRDWRDELVRAIAALQEDDGGMRVVHERWMEGQRELITAYALVALGEAMGDGR